MNKDKIFPRDVFSTPIRILIADAHEAARLGICLEMAKYKDMIVLGEATNGEDAITLAYEWQPDVLIFDVMLPSLNGLQVAQRLMNGFVPATSQQGTWPPKLVVLTAHYDKQYVWSLFAAGVQGYLLKDELPAQIVRGIREVANGRPALSVPVQRVLIGFVSSLKHELSVSEVNVLKLLAHGCSDEEIAQSLMISEGTVKNHLNNVYRKLPPVRTRAEAIAWAWMNKIV